MSRKLAADLTTPALLSSMRNITFNGIDAKQSKTAHWKWVEVQQDHIDS
jgi:hypothetical protein